jgi:hypothetical protein
MTAFDMTDSIIPRSDQINAEDILSEPRTITITDVKRGTDEQPVDIVTAEFGPGRPYKPSKTMRRVIVMAWGPNTAAYIGRRLTIYRDPEVRFGPDKVGGIKISHMSHIDKRLQVALTVTRGRRAQFAVDPLKDEPAPKPAPTSPPISDDDALDLTRSITEAATIADLDEIARDLKALELGGHRAALMSAWSGRKAAIEAAK